MGQNLFINFDAESLNSSRCISANDLRNKRFSTFVAGDSLVFDLFLTGFEGLLNIQDYPVVRMGIGNLNARPESGTYEVGGFSLDYNHSAAELEATIESATGNGCTVVELSSFVFKVSFDAVGAQAIPAIDSSDLTPRSTVDRQTLQLGDATTKEIWLWRLYANPVAFTDSFSNIAGDGVRGTIALSTAGIYDLLGNSTSVRTFFEIELTDSVGDIITVLQTRIDLTGEVIGEGFAGYIPSPTPLSVDIQDFLASADYAAARNNLLDTDSVIWCNDGDNIQAKYDEAGLLLGNTKTLIVMAGTYGNVELTDANILAGVNIIGIGNPTLGSIIDNATFLSTNATYKNFTCNSFFLNIAEGNIENITTTSYFNVYRVLSLATIKDIKTGTYFQNYENNGGTIKDITCGTSFKSDIGGNRGTIKNVSAETVVVENNFGTVDNVNSTNDWVHLANTGTIKNCSGNLFLEDSYNDGIIDNCHSTGTDARAFGGNLGSYNSGTIKNCTAKGIECFGQQTVTGVTEYCTSGDRAFAGSASNLDFFSGLGVQGTYRNCVAGNLSFFGYNNTTNGVKTVEATYINCTAGSNSFGFVNTVGAETHFSGKAINCIGETNAFFNSGNGGTTILNGAILENCIGGVNSFAKSISSYNEGVILRCRTGTFGVSAFSVTGTGKVRLCLDANFNEVNLG